MHRDWFPDDKPIADHFSNALPGIGIRDFVYFIRVEPDLALTAAHDGRGKALLSS